MKSLPTSKNKLYTLMTKSLNRKKTTQKNGALECTRYKLHSPSGMDLQTELGPTDQICTEDSFATEQAQSTSFIFQSQR